MGTQSRRHEASSPNGIGKMLIAIITAFAFAAVASTITIADPALAQPADWASDQHRYRLPFDVTSVDGGADLVAVVDVDFTAAFVDASTSGAAFDPATLRVHEVGALGTVLNPEVAFQFDPAPDFDAVASARGELVVTLAGTTPAGAQRTFMAYFEQSGVSTDPVVVQPVLSLDAGAMDEGVPAALITTNAAAYYYDLAGGGFSSIVDASGNDWVSHSDAPGFDGAFRGVPNLVYPAGYFHPGSTSATTTIDASGPLRVALTSTTQDGWSIRWEVFASSARATVLAAPGAYWFLYEGTPGGALDASDLVISSDGSVTSALDPLNGDIVGDEWIAFADPGLGRSLFVANHVDDAANDFYESGNDSMTVFGFGRDGLGRRLTGVDRSFSIGLVDSTSHAGVGPSARTAIRPPAFDVGIAQRRPNDPAVDAPVSFVGDDFNVPELSEQWTFIDPVGDSTLTLVGAGSGNASAQITLPAGSPHDAFGSNNAARLMQPIANEAFELEAGFVTAPTQRYQLDGLLVEESATNWLRFGTFHDGISLRLYAGRTIDGTTSTLLDRPVPAETRFFRLAKSGASWTGRFSSDGISWSVGDSFTADLAVSSAGVFAGNAGPNPAYASQIDYVYSTDDPVVPEDPTYTSHAVDVRVEGNGAVTRSPDKSVYIEGDTVTLTASADSGESFVGWTGDVDSSNPIVEVVVGSPLSVVATFTATSPDSGFVSDDFDAANLGSQWTIVDPVGDSVVTLAGTGTGEASATVSVAGGVSHDAYHSAYNTVRLMQPVADVDFELEAGFASAPSARYQISGLIIEEDDANWLRFDTYSDGTRLWLYAGKTTAGQTAAGLQMVVPGDTKFLRLGRNGDVWTGGFSSDGSNWTTAGSFQFALDLTAAGVHAGNAGPSPAFDAVVDYVFDTSNPIVPEDAIVGYDVETTILGDGTVSRTPDQELYSDGSTVRLSAVPDPGATFIEWTGDVVTTDLIIDVTINGGPVAVVANFSNAPPQFPIDITLVGEGTVQRSPDQATYVDGTVVTLTATPAAAESFLGWSGDVTSSESAIDVTINGAPVATTASFSTTVESSGFVSDDFNSDQLATHWTFVDPRGDSSATVTGAGTGTAGASLSVPVGVSHDPYNTNRSARIMQAIQNVDFELEAAFDSVPSESLQMNGFIVEQDSTHWFRFDAVHSGGGLDIYAGRTVAGQTTQMFRKRIPADTRFFRLGRVDDTWTGWFSSSGEVWTQAGSFDFAINVTSAGVFSGNAGSSPAYTAVVDYVFDTATPVVPEDAVAQGFPINVSIVGQGLVSKSPDQVEYQPGTVVELTAVPTAGHVFTGWSGDVTSTSSTIDVTVADSITAITATFVNSVSGFTSDDFNDATFDGAWMFVDPRGDSSYELVGVESGQATVNITVPAGTPHDAYNTNNSARLVQSIDDTDVQLEVGFESSPTKKFQSAGLLVEQDAAKWLRFDIYHTGTELRVYAGATTSNSTQTKFNSVVPVDTRVLQLTRTDDLWTARYSADGANWTVAGGFAFPLVARTAGVFAGNAGPSPAHTAVVDYMFDMATPIEPEDGGTAYVVESTTEGDGSVIKDPDHAAHSPGSTVRLTALPDTGAEFLEWIGDVRSTDPVIDIVVANGPVVVTARFTDAPITYAVESTVVGDGTVTADPNQATYADGSVVRLTAAPDLGEEFLGWTGDVDSMEPVIDVVVSGAAVAVTATFTSTAPTSGFVSDDFDAFTLGDQWTFVDPRGGSDAVLVGAGSGQATVELRVPGGVPHDAYGVNNTARLVQPINDTDFTLEVGFASDPMARFQINGLLIEQDNSTWIRYDIYHDGTKLNVFGARTVAGSTTSEFNIGVPSTTRFLRLARIGQTWTGQFSSDGAAWTTAGSFDVALGVTSAGVFAGNAGAAPAHTAAIDYVFDTSTPVVPEDGTTTYAVTAGVTGDGTVSRSPDQVAYADGSTVQLTALPSPGASFIDWTGDVVSANPVIDVMVTGAPVEVTANFTVAPPSYPVNTTVTGRGTVMRDPDQAAYFDGTVVTLTATPELGEQFLGWTGAITSPEPSETVTVSGAPVDVVANFTGATSGIDVWYGPTQTFGDQGVTQRWVNVLGRASDTDGISSLTYRLNGGPAIGLTVGGDLRRVYNEGDFNVEIDSSDLTAGNNIVELTLVDGFGESTTETVTVTWAPATASMTQTIDWSTFTDVSDGAQIVDGKWTLENGAIRTQETGYDRTVTIGDLAWDDYEVEVPVTIHALGPGSGTPQSGEPLVGLGMRWQGHSVTGTQPNYGFYPTGAFAWWRTNPSGNRLELFGNNNSPKSSAGFEMAFGTTYIFKARSETVGTSTDYKYKVWEQGTPEPPAWNTSISDDDSPASGSLVLIAHHYDVSFGNISITPVI